LSAPISVAAPEGVNQTVTRDPYGSPTAIKQSGVYNGTETDSITKTLVYDIYHRLCRTTEPESGDSTIAYDGANNVRATASGLVLTETGCARDQVPTASTTNYTYSPTNRVKTIAPPAGTQSTQYFYDNVGNVTSTVSGYSTWNGSYNFRNMLTGESLAQIGQTTVALGYAHDGYGSLTLIHYPNGENVSYLPNPRGRDTQAVSSSGNYATSVSYFANGQIASYVLGNGVAYVADQNQRQIVKDFSYGTVSALSLGEALTYDSDANITAVADLQGGPRGKAFGYDGLNRLNNAQAPALWGSQGFKYDPLNNLRVRIDGSQTSTYNYDATNRLLSITGGATPASFQYDTRGNVVNKNGVVFAFDQKDQLSQIAGYDSYLYNADGLRTIKTAANGGATTFYFYSRAGQLMYQWEPAQSKATNFIYLGSKLLARNSSITPTAPGAISFNQNPSNGSVVISWGSVPQSTSYTVQQATGPSGPWATVATTASLSATVSGLAGGTYYYQVQACASDGCGPWVLSSSLGVTPAGSAISVPSGAINGAYTVSWAASPGASVYSVQESLNGGAWIVVASNISATSLTRPGNASGVYTYQVATGNAYGSRGWSATSSPVYVVLQPSAVSFDANPNNGSFTVSWSAVGGASSYVLQENANGAGWVTLSSAAATTLARTGYTGGTYLYRVQACVGAVCGAWTVSSALGVTPNFSTMTVPSAPVLGTYTISWSAPASASAYSVQESVNGGAWTLIAYNTNATSMTRPGTTSGLYTYQVQAGNAYGSRGWSATSAQVSVPAVPSPPTNIRATADANGKIIIVWDAMQWATTYHVIVYGAHGALGQYLYTVATNSFNMVSQAPGKYTLTVSACSIAGCSAAVSNSNGLLSVGGSTASSMQQLTDKAMQVMGMSTVSKQGCTTTQCTVVSGGNP
jgi:hypothetical protein